MIKIKHFSGDNLTDLNKSLEEFINTENITVINVYAHQHPHRYITVIHYTICVEPKEKLDKI